VLALKDYKMKITKRQLRRIIKEEKQRLIELTGPSGGPDPDAQTLVDSLLDSQLGRQAEQVGEDEVYIMTGEAEGVTVRVMRRGR
jgi:hypothetical protein